MVRAMRIALPALAALSLATSAQAQPLGGEQPLLKDVAAAVSPARQKATIEKLVSFGTRHTGSDTRSEKRGIGAARRWIASEFEAASRDCGGRLKVATPSRVMTAERLAGPTEVMNVLGNPARRQRPKPGDRDLRPLRQPGHRSEELHLRRAGRQRRRLRNGGRDRGRARALQAPVPGDPGLRGPGGRGTGPAGRQGAGRLRGGARLERRGQPQQRHCRQHRGYRRRPRQHSRPDLLGRHAHDGDGGGGQPPPLQWRRGRQSLAQPRPLHGRVGRPLPQQLRRGDGLSNRPLQPGRRPGGDAEGRLPRRADHRGGGELHPPAPGPRGPRTASGMATRSMASISPTSPR